MDIAGPYTDISSWEKGQFVGQCATDTLSGLSVIICILKNFVILMIVSIPGFGPPPIICGYNTGQHMWVPASDSCVTLTLDIDTATTSTTRNWNIKVTQYECGNLMAPEQNCLQYHTAQTGL